MNIIDGPGLTDAPVPATIYARALSLEGYMLTEEHRIELLKSMRVPGAVEPGTTILTGPVGAQFWSAAPVAVKVIIVPGESEVPQDARHESLVSWLLQRRGLSLSESRKLAASPPTERHKHYEVYVLAYSEAAEWDLYETHPVGWFLERLAYLGEHGPPATEKDYTVTIVDTPKKFRALSKALAKARDEDQEIGLDVESDEEDDFDSRLVGVGLAFPDTESGGWPKAHAFYLPLNGPVDADACLSLLRLYFYEHAALRFVAHNGKFDIQVFAKSLDPENPAKALRHLAMSFSGDGLVAAYVLARTDRVTGRPEPRDLKYMTKMTFGVTYPTYQEMLGLSGAARSSECPLTDIGPYCCADAYWGVLVRDDVVRQLERTPKLRQMYERLELPTAPLLGEMELLGFPIDRALLRKRRVESERKVDVYRRYLEQTAVDAGYVLKVEKKMCKLHGKKKVEYESCPECDDRGRVEVTLPLNLGSRLQVIDVLQGTFALPRMASTPGGDPSNDEPALLRLREFTPDVAAADWITFLLAWRKEDKTRGTYLVAIDERVRRDDWQGYPGAWFIHPRFNQDVVESGRLSSNDPNGQNIPFPQRDLWSVEQL